MNIYNKNIISAGLGSRKFRSLNGEMSELAEGARLEIVCAVKSGTEGSNPSLSANKSELGDFSRCELTEVFE